MVNDALLYFEIFLLWLATLKSILQPSKLKTRVRFPLPAPTCSAHIKTRCPAGFDVDSWRRPGPGAEIASPQGF